MVPTSVGLPRKGDGIWEWSPGMYLHIVGLLKEYQDTELASSNDTGLHCRMIWSH